MVFFCCFGFGWEVEDYCFVMYFWGGLVGFGVFFFVLDFLNLEMKGLEWLFGLVWRCCWSGVFSVEICLGFLDGWFLFVLVCWVGSFGKNWCLCVGLMLVFLEFWFFWWWFWCWGFCRGVWCCWVVGIDVCCCEYLWLGCDWVWWCWVLG